MSTKERISLVLWAILALSLCGCTTNVQVGGRHNTIQRAHKEKGRTVRLWGRDMKANSLQEGWEKNHGK